MRLNDNFFLYRRQVPAVPPYQMVPTDQVPRSLYQTDFPIRSPPLLFSLHAPQHVYLLKTVLKAPDEGPWEGPKPLLSNTSDTLCDHIGPHGLYSYPVATNLIHCLSYYGAVDLLEPTAVFCFVLSWRHNNVTLGTSLVWRMTMSLAVVQPPVAD